jgi:hypothetical protein
MEKLARVQKDLEAVVEATRKAAEEKLGSVQAVCALAAGALHPHPRADPCRLTAHLWTVRTWRAK